MIQKNTLKTGLHKGIAHYMLKKYEDAGALVNIGG